MLLFLFYYFVVAYAEFLNVVLNFLFVCFSLKLLRLNVYWRNFSFEVVRTLHKAGITFFSTEKSMKVAVPD
jgi:hypothetical protein